MITHPHSKNVLFLSTGFLWLPSFVEQDKCKKKMSDKMHNPSSQEKSVGPRQSPKQRENAFYFMLSSWFSSLLQSFSVSSFKMLSFYTASKICVAFNIPVSNWLTPTIYVSAEFAFGSVTKACVCRSSPCLLLLFHVSELYCIFAIIF